MFKRVLIANRGEIAVRIIRACQELGIESVAVYSDVDVDALHVRLADYACRIGPAEAPESYLNGPSIIAAAVAAEADAIHPGYGFLSENAEFAEAVRSAGIVFIGPLPETIRMVGNKDAARDAMQRAGLPMIIGSAPIMDIADVPHLAEPIGYPVIAKPISGGGGKGMFVAHSEEELLQKMELTPFTPGSIYLERYVSDARHIEIQIMADNYGHIIHLGERECSLQRRNQKILEEAPSSALTTEMRQKVGSLAILAAKSVNYTNIGTVEFLMDKKNREFYFMEINPRIQVEHGITEIITRMDIVRKQIRIAAGEPLNVKQENIRYNGHAIECRINAEDPELNFMPCPGTIDFYHQPGGPNVRVDSGVCCGSTVQPYYDSLIAKIIVHGRTRGDAIRIMKRALAEYRISGVKSTVDLHRRVLSDPSFCSGNFSTQFVQNFLK